MHADGLNTVDTSSAMILIIAEPFDTAAMWLASNLWQATKAPIRVVTPSQLVYAPVASHRLSTSHSEVTFALADGTLIKSAQLLGVINRMMVLPQAHLKHAAPDDQIYAQGELYAFVLGWLSTLGCPVLNLPAPESLCGPVHSEITMFHFAALAGLGFQPMTLSSRKALTAPTEALPATTGIQIHIVFDSQLIGPIVPQHDRDALLQLCHLWGGRMLQIETRMLDGRRHFVAATSLIDFPRAGTLLVRAIAKALQR
jgi:hypothetical protein